MYTGPNIVTNGLVLSLDAANRNSLLTAPTVNLVTNPLFSGSNNSQTQAITSNWVFSGDSGTNGFRFYTGSIGGVTPLFPGEGMVATLGPNTVPNNRRIYYQGGSEANTTYTLSFYYYMTGSLISGDLVLINEYSGSTSVKSVYYPLTSASLNTWTRNITTFTTGTSSTGTTNWGPVMSFSATTGLFMQRFQIEKSPYANDFVSGSTSLTWFDLCGNNNGTLVSASATTVIPRFNSLNENVLNFDGTGSYVSLSGTVNLGNTFTILAWIKLSTLDGGDYVVYGPDSNGSDNWFGINSNSVNIFATETADVNNFTLTGGSISSTNVWYFIGCTINGTVAKVYLDGIEQNSVTKAFTIGSWNSSIISIGRRAGISQRYFPGRIANVYAYSRVLSSAEILQNYNGTKSRFNL